jgi:copper chaperone CopZ
MKATIHIQNLKCGGCAKTITSKVSVLPNISNVIVDVESSSVSFNYNDFTDAVLVKDKLKSIGYPSIEMDNSALSKAKSFVSCASGKISRS